MIKGFPEDSRSQLFILSLLWNVALKSYRNLSSQEIRSKTHKDQSDKYLSKIFWMAFLIKGASGSRQISLPFFREALQRIKKKKKCILRPWVLGAKDQGVGRPCDQGDIGSELTPLPPWSTGDPRRSPADERSFWGEWPWWINTRNAILSPPPRRGPLRKKENVLELLLLGRVDPRVLVAAPPGCAPRAARSHRWRGAQVASAAAARAARTGS